MSFKLCSGVEGSPIKIHVINGEPDGVNYQAIQVDGHGECMKADEADKTTMNNEQAARMNIDFVPSEVCQKLISDGTCPMIAWGILKSAINPDSF